MKTKADRLIRQIQIAQQKAAHILFASDLSEAAIVYSFATTDTLVINCPDYETTWVFDEAQTRLRETMDEMGVAIQTILIEMQGKLFFEL